MKTDRLENMRPGFTATFMHTLICIGLMIITPPTECVEHGTKWDAPQVLEDATTFVSLEQPLDDQTRAIDIARLAADPQRIEYQIIVKTGRDKDASSTSPVFLTIHGTEGDTGEFSLVAADSPYSPLKQNHVATVTKSLKDVGTIKKIRLRNPSQDDWQCANIRIKKAGSTTEFKVDAWVVSPTQTTRWAYAEVEYMLMVTTGAMDKADTAEPQSITIYGAQGSTGKLQLARSFEKETSVEVTVLARDVGKPSYITLYNPSKDEWYCTSIRMTTAHGSFDFSVAKWVSTPIHPKAHVPVDRTYQVIVDTAPDFDDGTEGEIYIQLFGTTGASTVHLLSKGIEPKRKSSMDVSAKDVGRLTKIKLSTGSKDGWHCKTVDIYYDDAKKHAHFEVHAWVQAPVQKVLSALADVRYTTLIKTGNHSDADSTGDFAVNIYGTLGVTRTLPLKIPEHQGFLKGASSRFELFAKDVGEITRIRLSTQSSDEWRCQDVTITKDGTEFPFSVDKWVAFPLATTVDTNVDSKYTFSVVTGKQNKADTSAMIYVTLYGTRGQSRYLPLKTGFDKGTTESVFFKTQDVGQLTRIKLTTTSTDEWFCESITVQYGGDSAKFQTKKWLVFPESANIYVDRHSE